jgi:hypothetical protein
MPERLSLEEFASLTQEPLALYRVVPIDGEL